MSNYSSTLDGSRDADYQKLSQTISKSIQKIIQNVSSLQRMVNQLGTAQDSPELKQQLHQILTYTQQLISDTQNLIDELGNRKYHHLKMQRDRLVDEYTSALNAFQAVQRKTVEYEKSALKQARSQMNKQHAIAHPPGSNKTGSAGSSYNNGPFEDSFTGMGMSQQRQQQAQVQEEIDMQALEEQERSIRQLEENIVGVNEIYKNLGTMVYEQGAMVDSIEASVEQTNVFVSEGSEQLKKAHQYKTKAMKKKFYLALFLAIFVAVIIMIIYLSH